jgi:hypothetical protein
LYYSHKPIGVWITKLIGRIQTSTAHPDRVVDVVEHALTARRPERRPLLGVSSRAQKAFFGHAPVALTDAALAAATTAKVPSYPAVD